LGQGDIQIRHSSHRSSHSFIEKKLSRGGDMVGLVLVSHSRALANALVELVRQVASGDVPLAVAAGVGPDRSEFGTDAIEIMEAIQSVHSPDGVVLLMDLGSAILSAQMALELLPPEIAESVHLCSAPFVEGAIAAAVQAGLGSSAALICQEALGALAPKHEQLAPLESAPASPAATPTPAAESESAALTEKATLHNPHGLHARPAARFVQLAASFDAVVKVRNLTKAKGPVAANSLNGLATLGAVNGDRLAIEASGREARPALNALLALVHENFGEGAAPAEPSAPPVVAADAAAAGAAQAEANAEAEGPAEPGLYHAVPVSEGIAYGPLAFLRAPRLAAPQHTIDDPEAAWARLQTALRSVETAVNEQRDRVAARLGNDEAAIFDAHILILRDPELLDSARKVIFEQNLNEAAAWDQAVRAIEQDYQALDDPYLRQRSADIADLGGQVLNALLGGQSTVQPLTFDEPVLLFTQELTPNQTASLDVSKILGLITVAGGPTSHSTILARAMGIPAVAGADPILESLPAGTSAALDGFRGRVWITPTPQRLGELQTQRADWLAQREALLKTSRGLALTRDGRRVEVAANIGSLLDADLALKNGCEGVGLLRTEFLFLTRETPPDEEEQFTALAAIAQRMGNLPVVVRTMDIGGDKALPYIPMTPEANPFLGVRAIRLSFQQEDLFRSQLRAILRAAAQGNLRIMFPMIASLDEVLHARRLLETAHSELQSRGAPHAWPIQTGIMVEIPSAAVLSNVLAPHVDFFSIGTNDLTQYTLAAERGNPALAALGDALHPAVLHLIRQVAEAAHANGRWVGVCGELAGDPAATAVLVGLGVDELSLNAAGIPRIKDIVRGLDVPSAQALAQRVLTAQTAEEARRMAGEG
jgi:phosphocarrier protein FPr